ncbi:hypothetical protein PBY51_005180 [Eleginops maclovinus]|uniref:Uncharacterized protein n=1 Tax=Eleginops maclovinus TaxID=56733 RepID=A0AAN7X8R2_ELEMC|nr:hypothetical protein PBY51_005180 [Eleginops maclovinus]
MLLCMRASCCPHKLSIPEWIRTIWQISEDLHCCLKMDAGITLRLTAGYQTDTLTYFLPLGQDGGNKT